MQICMIQAQYQSSKLITAINVIVFKARGGHGCGRSNVPPILPTTDVGGTGLENNYAKNQSMDEEKLDNHNVME